MSFLRRSSLLWCLAALVTLLSAAWQRMSGPSYPAAGSVTLGGSEASYRLTRNHSTASDQPVRVVVADEAVTGEVRWRRYPTTDAWETLPMARRDGRLEAMLPRQPSSGKLEYQVRLQRGADEVVLPAHTVVTRFKDEVSAPLLVTHIACMFAALLFSARAGLGAAAGHDTRRLAVVALGLWVVGGLVLGPAVQKQAFGAWWTGVPFGYDLTDNKTLAAVLAWALAAWKGGAGDRGRRIVVAAALVTFAVFAIPHSVWGSELDWDGHRRT